MDESTQVALGQDKVIDITTTGRTTGKAQRIEIWYHRVDGRYYITGRPGPRSWYANLVADGSMTFHLKESAQVDLAARAVVVSDAAEKRRVLAAAAELVEPIGDDIESWVTGAPLVEVVFQ
ncbi:MAG TPA: nitroreductase/quinone reductase family protein [Dehalococcoidia bacterium]|nr:nitroreductase/quinone reductase family protein [Dehalococcoidia bacterium]